MLVELDKLLLSEGFHIVVVDNIDAEGEQVFAVLFLGGDEGTDIQFEFVEHGFVHDAGTVDEMTEETVFFDSGKVFFRYFLVASSAGIGLYSVHGINVLMVNIQ